MGPPPRQTQTGGRHLGALPGARYLQHEVTVTTMRIPMTFIPKETRGSKAPGSQLPLLSRGLPVEFLFGEKRTKMRRVHAGVKTQTVVQAFQSQTLSKGLRAI